MNDAAGRIARLLESAAFVCILAVLVARPFVTETPFGASQLVLTAAEAGEIPHKLPGELLRVTFAMVLLAAFVFWSIAQSLRRKFRPAGVTLAALILVFSAWTFVGAMRAVDVRGALTGWFEQTTILLSALVMLHLVASRKERLGLVVVVLVALAGAMAAKTAAEVVWEIPQRIAAFDADPEKQLANVGIRPGTPQATMFENRIRDRASLGYLGLSNVFASLLVVLVSAAAGLAIEKFVAARRSRRSAKLARGEIHLPTLAAWVGVVLLAVSAVALVLTRSKGGIAAAAVAVAAATLVMLRREFFARHRRKVLIACAAVVLAGICAVAAWGKIRGSLPGWSMQVRWEYWVGTVDVIRDEPVFGVGPGGFGDAYLRHRLPAAAESTKSPHNLIMDAAAQYGLAGGTVYLAMLVWMFLVIVNNDHRREVFSGWPEASPATASGRRLNDPCDGLSPIRWCVFLSLVVLITRAVWVGSMDPAVLLVDAVASAVVFGACLPAAMWVGTSLGWGGLGGRYVRIALAAGLAGFILHNFLTYTLWMPATATVFWVAAGAMAGAAFALRPATGKLQRVAPSSVAERSEAELVGASHPCPSNTHNLRFAPVEGATRYCLGSVMRIPAAILVAAAIVAAGTWLWMPVFNRTLHVRAAQEAFSLGRIAPAAEEMKLAVAADPLDAFAPADLARLFATTSKPEKAAEYAEKAWARSPTFSNTRILARTLRGIPNRRDKSLEMASKAVELNPMNMWFRREYAEMLLAASRFDEALRQIREIRRIHRARPTISDLRLTEEELKKLDVMEEKIKTSSFRRRLNYQGLVHRRRLFYLTRHEHEQSRIWI